MYRYICPAISLDWFCAFCIDTHVTCIDTKVVSQRQRVTCVSNHACMYRYTPMSLRNPEIQKHHDVSNHACMIWYISVKISRNWCMYRYTPVFVSIHRSNLSFLTLVKGFVSIQMISCIDTCLWNFAQICSILFSL